MKQDSPNDNKYMRYMGAGTQMLVTIASGVFLGRWLDEKVGTQTPWFAVGCSLVFIFAGMYLFIKSIPKE
ncbi:AtpZ/AtpI family protein [Arcicella rigui]|uniref:AtpZ/AtpI family protein n=1 Tax=Arcicella rigui TaxID=797020 RepID=A0ABU5Q7A5_9BACT|nr:AtpZ/AtpI family protein [Arcicella rigui]MEA5138736.1 AtpZ/AtpI family protein [Arcicella rigui]